MSKRVTLYLARDKGESYANVFRNQPTERTIPGKSCTCPHNATHGCYGSLYCGKAPAREVFRGAKLTDLCTRGLSAAGLPIKQGEILKISISVAKSESVKKSKPKKRK